MTLRNSLLAILAVIGIYAATAGVVGAAMQGQDSFLRSIFAPLERASSFDMLLLTGAFVLLGFSLLPNTRVNPLDRTSLLRGIALGSAMVTAAFVGLVVWMGQTMSAEQLGSLAAASALQAFVGLCAASLLLVRRESRRYAYAPVCVNSGLAVVCGLFLTGPQF
ncbi:MAG: hypothetical protein ACKVX7_07400 [Planctomycetota bacterium]